MSDRENLTRWIRAENYSGQDYSEYYLGPAISRNSEAIERSNFDVAMQMLGGESTTVIVVRFSHWCVGWIEAILVHESDDRSLDILEDIYKQLQSYPILDEEDYDKKRMDEGEDYDD